jgi:hypothetical protein
MTMEAKKVLTRGRRSNNNGGAEKKDLTANSAFEI